MLPGSGNLETKYPRRRRPSQHALIMLARHDVSLNFRYAIQLKLTLKSWLNLRQTASASQRVANQPIADEKIGLVPGGERDTVSTVTSTDNPTRISRASF